MQCRLENVTIDYEIHGKGRPLISIHGFPLDRRVMIGCMEPVAGFGGVWKRIYFDLPGMGKSQAADWISSSDQMLEVVLEFIDAVIPGQRFALAGESYGAYIARGVVSRKRDLVDGLLLICPLIVADAQKRVVPPQITLVNDPTLMSSLKPEDASEFGSIAVVEEPWIWQRFQKEILLGLRSANKSFVDKIRAEAYGFSFDVDEAVGTFHAPTLIVVGRQDSTVGYQDAWGILASYPRGSFAVLDLAGHNLQIEQSDLFNALVEEWLVRVVKFTE
ncbi:MAG: 2-hydroxy-6-oxo-6-phenylhexa-2,4-dienoate hydrolase [Candidatus Thorarchaeota archaeon]|nr:MAG: 2-hydroxy-6-oxo-6-phenylhexa-2,4-dienoate hydrolase [Candidatus Thorarchaeota archaeon]